MCVAFEQQGPCEDCGGYEFDDIGACVDCMLAADMLDDDAAEVLGINPASYLYA